MPAKRTRTKMTKRRGHTAKRSLTNARQEVQQSETRLRAIIDTAVDAIITIDHHGIIHSVNSATEKMFAYTSQEMIGQSIKMLMPSPYREEHDGYLANFMRTGVKKIIGIGREVTAMRKDGSIFPIDLAVSSVPGEKEPLFAGVIRDLTERRKDQERLRISDRLTAIGTLAAGLGHDMNNVLLHVRTRLKALQSDQLSTQSRTHIAEIHKSLAYLQQLTDGLHLLALNPEDMEASEKTTDVAEWWKQVRPLIAIAVPKHVAFHDDVADDLPPVAMPPHQLTQAMLNLVVNAGEAIASAGISKSSRVQLNACALSGGREVEWRVIDNGPGMTPEVKALAFDPFFTTKKRGLGTGLGLAMVWSVVKMAGGTVMIKSEVGKGTTVVLTLPAVVQSDKRVLDETLLAVVSIADPRACSYISAMLEAAGLTVRRQLVQETGRDSLAKLWVLDEELAEAREIEAMVAQGNCVVLVGASAPHKRIKGAPGKRALNRKKNAPGVFFVNNRNDPAALQDALARALELIRGLD